MKINENLCTIPTISIKLPNIVELALKHDELLRDAIRKYRDKQREHSKSFKISKTQHLIESNNDLLLIDVECLCPNEDLSFNFEESSKTKHVHSNPLNKNELKEIIQNILDTIFTEEILYENQQIEIKQTEFHQTSKIKKKKNNHIIDILPYENTYGQVYYPNQSVSIDKIMIEKIVHGVQAMGTALLNSKDIEETMLTNESNAKISDELMDTLQKRFLIRTMNRNEFDTISYRINMNLFLADNRLNGQMNICHPQSIIFSCMLRKLRLCLQVRLLCSYNDIFDIMSENDFHRIHLRTFTYQSLSFDEFIEILGEIYEQSSAKLDHMNTYFESKDVLDLDTNLLLSSLTINEFEQLTKYIRYEDAIRQICRLIYDRKRNLHTNECSQLKLNLPTKLNEFYQPIKKLNSFMSSDQILTALKKPYLSQLAQRAQTRAITIQDLRSIVTHIWLTPEDFEVLISNQTISSDILCQFYLDFHERYDVDNRLSDIKEKISDYLNSHSCLTRVGFKMLIERSNGTNLSYFLDEFNKIPRYLSIIDLINDLSQSGLISTSELLLLTKQEIIIKKSSLIKHFQRISFIRKHDADLLAQMSLIIREDELIEFLTNRTRQIQDEYIKCILNTQERRDFIEQTKKLSSVSIHQFIHRFNLNPLCGKIFYWMNLTDENIVQTLIETKTFVNEYTLDGIHRNFLTRFHDTLQSGIYYLSAENLSSDDPCQLGCYLTYEQALILVDFADPQYEQELSSLIIIRDIIPFDSRTDLSSILYKQEVIECKILLESFHQRILFRQTRFQRIENLQKLLLSSNLFDYFIEIISQLGSQYFTRLELDYLEEIKLIDIGVLAILFTLPVGNTSSTEQIDQSSNYLHVLDPIIEKYSSFLTTCLLRILSFRQRFSPVNQILLSNPTMYLSIDELLRLAQSEQILSSQDIQRICYETFSIESDDNDCYQQNIRMFTNNPDQQKYYEQLMILNLFDRILHLNYQTKIHKQLRKCFRLFKPLSIYTSQLIIEKELSIIELLLRTRKNLFQRLTINDLNKYIQVYPIPCRLDIINDLRRLNLISQSLTDLYTINQCQELKQSSPEMQTNFIFYMIIKLLRNEGYIDDNLLRKLSTDIHEKNIEEISRKILTNGCLTVEQIVQSIRAFFFQDYLDEEILRNQLAESKSVVEQTLVFRFLQQNSQFDKFFDEHFRRRQVIEINQFNQELKTDRARKEKLQRKVDHVLLKPDEHSLRKSSQLTTDSQQSNLNLRSLRHHYLQAKITRNQLHFLVEQGGWSDDVHRQFQHELDIIQSNNSLDLIRYITKTISILLQENGSVAQQPLDKYFQHHRILFSTDFELLLTRYGMVDLDDLVDLLVVCKVAKAQEIKAYAKKTFCLNVNRFREISKPQDDILVKKIHVDDNLEMKLCISSTDLSQLLNHFLKLDRLKHILDLLPTIRNYLHLHPINTFNAVKTLKLEFNLNHDDMKFLRDLKILSDTWYKQYLLSRISDTGPIISDVIDDEQEEDDEQQEFQFRPSLDEDLDVETLNDLFQNKPSQSNLSQQRKQIYLEEMQKRKDQKDSHKSKTSLIDEQQIEFDVDFDEISKEQRTPTQSTGVIEQFFPLASFLGPQLLIPYSYEQEKQMLFEMDFGEEELIEQDHDKTIVRQRSITDTTEIEEKQTVIEIDKSNTLIENIIEKEPEPEQKSQEEKQEILAKEVSKTKISQENIRESIPTQIVPSTELIEERVHQEPEQKSQEKEEESVTEETSETKISQENIRESISNQIVPSIELIDKTFSLTKSSAFEIPQTTEQLAKQLSESFIQMTKSDRNLFRKDLDLAQHNIDQWLQRTLQHNEQLNTFATYSNELSQLNTELIEYLQTEIDKFNETFLPSIANENLVNHLQQRTNQIEQILQENNIQQKLISQIDQQINDLDQMITNSNRENLLTQLNENRDKFNDIKSRKYLQIQSLLGTQLELAIRTLHADLQLIEQTFDDKTLRERNISSSLITKKVSRNVPQSIESKTYENMKMIRENLLNITNDLKKAQENTTENKYQIEDLLKKDMNERLESIKTEYFELKAHEETIQKAKENINKPDEIQQVLRTQSNQIQKNLSNILVARHHSNYPNIPFNARLKHLPVDNKGIPTEPAIYLLDKQNHPISDRIELIRTPMPSDRFQISNDQQQLIIVDKNQIPISDPITFQQLPVQFEYLDDEHQSIRISDQPLPIHIKSIGPINNQVHTDQALFVIDNNDRLLSKAIQIPSALDLSKLKLATFLYDEKLDDKVLLTPEQYLVSQQQTEFTPRKFLTFVINENDEPLSEPIEILDSTKQIEHSIEHIISKKLASKHVDYELLHGYIEDRLDRLKIEENIIEQIVPILDKKSDDISADQLTYKQAQANMDYLLNTMRSIVELDDQLTAYRKNKSEDRKDIQQLETNLINRLVEVANQLDDQSIVQQVENLTNQFRDTSLLTELRPVVLTGIKFRAKFIQKQCENLLINIYEKSNQAKQPEQIRLEYIQFLAKRFNERQDEEKKFENIYEKIERMQYEFYQKLADGSETIELEDIERNFDLKQQFPIDENNKSKTEKIINRFDQILQYLQNELTSIKQYKNRFFDEMKQFLIEPINSESSYIQQILFIENQNQIHQKENLLKSIEKLKILLNKFETITDQDNRQYEFLSTKIDSFYEIFRKSYQIELPSKNDVDAIRMMLNSLRKQNQKELEKHETLKSDLLRKLDVLKKKEELKQRTNIISMNEVKLQASRLNLLNAYIQQSQLEPINIHHEYYAMKIEQLTKDLVSFYEKHDVDDQEFSLRNTLESLKNYNQYLEKQKVDYEHEFIVPLQTIVNRTFDALRVFVKPNVEQEKMLNSIQQLKQRAIEIAKQSVEYARLTKHVSPQLLISNQITSGQELISGIALSTRTLFQLPIDIHVEEENLPETYLVQSKSQDSLQQIVPTDFQSQLLQKQIEYLQRQHAEAVTNNDFTQQIAAERALEDKLKRFTKLQPKSIQVESSSLVTSKRSARLSSVDQQIRGLMKKHVKQLQKRVQDKNHEKEIIHVVKDLRQLNDQLKQSREENNRSKQIDIQLQILDKIEQLDRANADQTIVENLRQHLHKEEEDQQQRSSVIQSSAEELHRSDRSQVLPTVSKISDSSLTSVTLEKTKSLDIVFATSQIIDSKKHQSHIVVPSTDAKKLYHELEKIRYSIDSALENLQTPSDSTENKTDTISPTLMKTGIHTQNDVNQLNSIRLPSEVHQQLNPTVTSSFITDISTKQQTNVAPEQQKQSSSLVIVGNVQKYSLIQTKTREQQIGKLPQRSILPSRRDYGDVYTRHRYPDHVSVQRDSSQHEKPQRKSRLVKFEKTRQGNTVIHHRLDAPIRTLAIPYQTISEENLQPVPPLIQVENRDETTKQPEVLPKPIKSKQSQSFDVKTQIAEPIYHSVPPLPPIEEESEPTDAIALKLITRDSQTVTDKTKQTETTTIKEQISTTNPPLPLSVPVVTESTIEQEIKSPSTITKTKQRRKSSKKRRKSTPVEQIEPIPFTSPISIDEISSTEPFDIKESTPKSTPVVYHKFGGKSSSPTRKKKKKKKKKKKSLGPNSLIHAPRKAVPFTSATKDQQIDVEDETSKKPKKTKRTRSKKSKRRRKKHSPAEHQPQQQFIEPKLMKNEDAIATHLLNVKRFADSHISPIHFDKFQTSHEDTLEQTRLIPLKPMIKNFELENLFHKHHLPNVDTYQLPTKLYDFNNDTKELDQPAIFNEYIPDFFQKQAEEKQIRRISLTAIRTDEDLIKRLAPRVPRLYTGWQPTDKKSAHTDQFHPLKKSLMTNLSYYFDDDFIDESGLFQNEKQFDKIAVQVKQPTQRFRDDYIVKEFFTCWQKTTKEKARIAELRRKRVMIDFREFWFQDALSNPFYSYFEQPADYRTKQNEHHQMAYRVHKRLVRTGREQPKETKNSKSRSSFLPMLFNLPKTYLDRQDSLVHRFQLIDSSNESMLLKDFLTSHDEILPFIRERIRRRNLSIDLHQVEIRIQQSVLENSLFENGTIDNLDRLIDEYLTTNTNRLPPIKQSSIEI